MSSDLTEWHDVATGTGSLYNWMMEGARYFSEFANLGRCWIPPPSLEIFWVRINTVSCIMKQFLLPLLNLDRSREGLLLIYKFVLREKSFLVLFTHFCLDLSIMLNVASDRSIFLLCY